MTNKTPPPYLLEPIAHDPDLGPIYRGDWVYAYGSWAAAQCNGEYSGYIMTDRGAYRVERITAIHPNRPQPVEADPYDYPWEEMPDWVEQATTDADGRIDIYEAAAAPEVQEVHKEWYLPKGGWLNMRRLISWRKATKNPDWRNSLRRRPRKADPFTSPLDADAWGRSVTVPFREAVSPEELRKRISRCRLGFK